MQTFTVNEFIKLELNTGTTNIIINGNTFHKCKYLLLSIPFNDVDEWEHFESMDDIIKATTGGHDRPAEGLTPEEEFHGHCSNLQAWAENGYDYRLLDTRLSIPIIIEIMEDLLEKYNSKDPVLANQKEYYKNKFKRFLHEAIQSLDDYIKSSLKNEATYGKFEFLYDVFFGENNIIFEPGEIQGSKLLSTMYAHFLPRSLWKKFSRQRSYWERKLWKKTPVVEKEFKYFVGDKEFYFEFKAKREAQRQNIAYRRFLRQVRSSQELDRKWLLDSDPIDYLPYLYAKGKFCGGIISFTVLPAYKEAVDGKMVEREQTLIIRDDKGIYYKATENKIW